MNQFPCIEEPRLTLLLISMKFDRGWQPIDLNVQLSQVQDKVQITDPEEGMAGWVFR